MIIEEITPELLQNGMDYKSYRLLIDSLLAEDKTTGDNHSRSMLAYTRQNNRRMGRLDRQTALEIDLKDALSLLQKNTIWIVLTEAWCGDAAQTIPVMAKAADECDARLKLVLRDENLDLMDKFLTDGARSIPVLLILEGDDLDLLGSWGPRPAPAQNMVMRSIASGEDYHDRHHDLHLWYGRDKTKTFQQELTSLIKKISART